jgi:hypothetical protein
VLCYQLASWRIQFAVVEPAQQAFRLVTIHVKNLAPRPSKAAGVRRALDLDALLQC